MKYAGKCDCLHSVLPPGLLKLLSVVGNIKQHEAPTLESHEVNAGHPWSNPDSIAHMQVVHCRPFHRLTPLLLQRSTSMRATQAGPWSWAHLS